MKRIFLASLSTVLGLFATSAVWAQVTVNPKAGVNLSGVETRLQDIRAEARAGWNAGLDLRMGGGTIFFMPGLHYYRYSAELKQDINGFQDIQLEEEAVISALKAPINLGLRLTADGGLLHLYARGGVTPTYILRVQETEDIDFTASDLRTLTWGANVGVGVDVLFLNFEANYELGLDDYFEAAVGHNNVFTLSVGMRF